MRRTLAVVLMMVSALASAQERKDLKDADLTKKTSAAPDKSLAGDLSRKKEEGDKKAPSLQYDQFRVGVELQVASKRRTLIDQLKKIISLSPDPKEAPKLRFQLAELLWEESKFFFIEANRKDDELIEAINRKDVPAQQRAKAEKAQLQAKSKEFSKQAIAEYTTIVQSHRDFERMDEVLYFLGNSLMEDNEDRKALVVFNRLITKYPKSKYVPDAHLAFGEFYFNTSKGKRELLLKALESYSKAAEFTDSQVYAFAIYKQGWCHFNLAQYDRAMDKFAAVVLYGELAGASALEKDGGKSGKNTLIKEARNDYVRAYARIGTAGEARATFGKVAQKQEDRWQMMKQLANLFYEDGKDRDAAVAYNILIQEKPLSPEAPGFQGRIVDCVMRAGNKKQTVQQVRRLVKVMQDVESSGVIKEDKDKQALADAKELSERTLSNLAVSWHNEAKKTRDDETFELANQVYADYLTLFPENPKAYDLRFFWAELLNDNLLRFGQAAQEYTKVALQDVDRIENGEKDAKSGQLKKPGKPGKWFTNALYNAILAYDEVVKKADEAKPGDKDKEKTAAADFKTKLEISGERKALLEACDRYIKYQPKGEKRVEIAFKAANIFYRHNHFDEAVLRFSEIALGYPDYKFETGERAGEVAANLVLDSYNILADWEKVNEWARRFYGNERLAVGKFREDLAKLIEQSAFKLVNQLEAKKEYAKAGEAYLKFVAEFPQSEIADRALFNASVDFHNAKLRDRAVQVRNRIIRDYPRSEFVPGAIYANAETLESIGDFAEAAEQYERYAAGYERSLNGKEAPRAKASKKARGKHGRADAGDEKKQVEQKWEESKAQIALFNAGVFREYLGQLKQALRNRERYLAIWPAEGKTAKDAEPVFLSIADLYEKMGAYTKALSHIEDYERRYLRDPNKVLYGEGRLVELFGKLRKARDVQRIQGRILKYYEELPKRVRANLEPRVLEVVAKAHFDKAEEDYRFYTAARLRWGQLPSPEREFKATLGEKAKRLKAVQDRYTETVSFKAGDPAICALFQIGNAYEHFAHALVNAPLPRGLPEDVQDAFREELGNQANAPKEKAAEAYATAVAKSRELDIFNDCAKKALTKLREEYRPDQYPTMLEHTAEFASVKDVSVQGADLLAELQEVPQLSEEQLAKAKESAKAIDTRTAGLKVDGREKANETTPAKANAQQTQGSRSNDDEPQDEPEDFLE